MRHPMLTILRHAGLFMRTITGTVLVTFTMLVLAPTAAAVQADHRKAREAALLAPTEEEMLSKTVEEIDARLERMKRKLEKGEKTQAERAELKVLREKVRELDKSVLARFAEVGKHIKAKKLDPVILKRHQEAVAIYKQEFSALLENLQAVDKARNEVEFKQGIDKAKKHLAGRKHKRAQQPFDPNHLPNHHLPPAQVKPKKTKKDFTRADLHDTPYQKYAALGDFKYDKLPGADDPAYLAESVEVRMTDSVRAKAAELNHDPVKIYHWVLNNVEWLPTWGAMQDADHTLSSRRGNAMDIASLTIALLRASGIPARYVHGTLEVPEAKFRNWAGGFESIEAAAGFAASGGIPTTGVSMGGEITKVQMEHVWVEAAIDYLPSRGAVNREADSWVEFDPSFKQYEYLAGLDVAQIAGIDGAALAQQFTASGTMNTQEGWVQGLDPSILQNAQVQAKTALENHLAQMPNPTVGEVIGGRKTIVRDYPGLPSSLTNKRVVRGAHYSALPARLQHKITLALGQDPYAEIIGGTSPEITYPLARVNNRKVTVSFKPATAADEEALQSLLPEGDITDVSQLPTSIPAYLIKVVPELRVEGEVVLTGATSMALGSDFKFRYATDVVSHGKRWYESIIPAGSYYAVQIAGGSVAPARLDAAKQRLEAAKSALEAQDLAFIAGLTRDDLLGEMFHVGTLGYSAEYEGLTRIAGLQQGAIDIMAPSMGVYGYKPKVIYSFGFPRAIAAGGVEMDLPGQKGYNATLNGNREQLIGFRLHNGLLGSALEHSIPEQMFVTPEAPGEGISAV
ncbi:MAG: hypothetical protein M0R77_15650, partial [Gammaproteobacteria bacterium]|nr:hypothetical protein [Gammaproteobacteria bacterium]